MHKNRPSNTDIIAPCLCGRIRANSEWDALTADEVDLFNRNVICRTYKSGRVIFVQGDPCNGMYFVEDGLIAVRKVDENGQSAIVRLAHQGDTLGYRPLLAKENHRATAEVIKDARVCFIERNTIRILLLSNSKLGMRFLEQTAKSLGEAEERLFQVATLSVRIRIIHLLVLLQDHYGTTTSDGTIFIELPMTRRDLAEMVGARPESVSRALRDIQEEGLVNLSGRNLRVDQLDLLVNELHTGFHI